MKGQAEKIRDGVTQLAAVKSNRFPWSHHGRRAAGASALTSFFAPGTNLLDDREDYDRPKEQSCKHEVFLSELSRAPEAVLGVRSS